MAVEARSFRNPTRCGVSRARRRRRRRRWRASNGALVFLLLLPLVPVEHVTRSRQVLAFAIGVCALLPGRGAAPGPCWPIRLVQLQLSVLYGVNALAKCTPEYLSGGVLTGFSRMLPHFHPDLSDGLLELPPFALPVGLAAPLSVAVEAGLALGIWIPRLRIPTALLGIGFHGMLRHVLTIGWLDWACVTLYASFLLPFTPARGAGAGNGGRAEPPSGAGCVGR